MYFAMKPMEGFPTEKLFQAAGHRPWSGRLLRFVRHATQPYVMVGAATLLSYQIIRDYLRHHEEGNNDRPVVIDHMIATTAIMTVAGGFIGGLPKHALTGFVASVFLISPMSWWIYKHGRMNSGNRPADIFYENSVTPEEIERIQNLDLIE